MKTNRYYSTSITVVLSLLTTLSGASAQYRWHVTHSDHALKSAKAYYQYSFTSVDCSGEVCTAAGFVLDSSIHAIGHTRIMFFRSTDDGSSWVEQDPGLPLQRGTQNEIRVVQQIDSLNVVAIGDSGLIVRTSDGGKTWEKQNFHSSEYVTNVHFSDPMTGVAILDRPTTGLAYACDILTTNDGGNNWLLAPFSPFLFGTTCHSDGGGIFRVISYDQGPVYKTNDNWSTVDSTPLIVPQSDSTHVLRSFNFRGTNDLIGFGVKQVGTVVPRDSRTFFTRSTDGGRHWGSIALSDDTSIASPLCMSSLDRDIVFSGGLLNGRWRIAVSSDHGNTWSIDSLALDAGYPVYSITSVAVTSNSTGVAVFSSPGKGSPGMLVRGQPTTANVQSYERIIYNTQAFPNPATNRLSINSIDQSRPVHIIDVLGREVLRGELDSRGQVTFDVSSLPRGIYAVMLDHFGRLLPVGKVAVVAKE